MGDAAAKQAVSWRHGWATWRQVFYPQPTRRQISTSFTKNSDQTSSSPAVHRCRQPQIVSEPYISLYDAISRMRQQFNGSFSRAGGCIQRGQKTSSLRPRYELRSETCENTTHLEIVPFHCKFCGQLIGCFYWTLIFWYHYFEIIIWDLDIFVLNIFFLLVFLPRQFRLPTFSSLHPSCQPMMESWQPKLTRLKKKKFNPVNPSNRCSEYNRNCACVTNWESARNFLSCSSGGKSAGVHWACKTLRYMS